MPSSNIINFASAYDHLMSPLGARGLLFDTRWLMLALGCLESLLALPPLLLLVMLPPLSPLFLGLNPGSSFDSRGMGPASDARDVLSAAEVLGRRLLFTGVPGSIISPLEICAAIIDPSLLVGRERPPSPRSELSPGRLGEANASIKFPKPPMFARPPCVGVEGLASLWLGVGNELCLLTFLRLLLALLLTSCSIATSRVDLTSSLAMFLTSTAPSCSANPSMASKRR